MDEELQQTWTKIYLVDKTQRQRKAINEEIFSFLKNKNGWLFLIKFISTSKMNL